MKSIARKIWLLFIGVILIILLALWLMLSQFYENYYYNEQTAQLITYGETIANMINSKGSLSQEEVTDLDRLITARTMIFDKNGLVQACSGQMGMMSRGIRLDNEEIKKVLNGENTVKIGLNQALGQTVLAVAVPIKTSKGIIGGVYLFKPISSIEKSVKAIREIMAFAALIAILIATILAFFLSKTISKPLLLMQNTAKSIARGNFNTKLKVESKDEIGNLALSLNDMSDKLKRVDVQRKDFVANVSHELRTPLHLIQGYSEALIDFQDDDQETRTKYAQIILDETKRLSGLVGDLLLLSKSEDETYTLVKEKTNLIVFLEQIIDEYLPVAKGYNLDLNFEVSGEIGEIAIDQPKIKQVLINLLDNACRYGADGGKVIIVLSQKAQVIQVVIRDFGKGISQEDIPHIWERFYRVDKSRKRETGGNGIGLAIVKNIIFAHGGQVSVESKLDEFTEFAFTLPIFP